MKPFPQLVTRVAAYAVATGAIYAVVYYDARLRLVSEASWTEWTQQFLLLVMVLLAARTARRYVALRAFVVLLGFVALISLVREFNNTLLAHTEHVLGRWAWKLLVGVCFVPAVLYFRTRLPRLRDDILTVADSFAFGILISGTLLLHVFSRLYGANEIWRLHMGDAFDRSVARISEESVELVAYGLILGAVLQICARARRDSERGLGPSSRAEGAVPTRPDRRAPSTADAP